MASDTNTLAIATRLHLGHAAHPPPSSQLFETLSSFSQLASTIGADHAVVAVDAEEKIEGYDLVEEVTKICDTLNGGEINGSSEIVPPAPLHVPIQILPVTPWGKFVPALNAIVSWCARKGVRYLLAASAEVQLTEEVLGVMKQKLDLERTLVVGTALQGHEYKSTIGEAEKEVELTGRTTPWNTCSLWNVPKLALTGFLLISEGLHPEEDGTEGASGVEEVCTIATLQRILQPENAQAKLVSIPGTSWGQDFGNDEKRREWHERKMMSKYSRAKKQLDLLGLSGTVIHC
eukprot:CAMPEP_0183706554 /NCGR_PEP_ID=MMETSP0737-20130205/3330_1 /TAXON_ID=385413 /ORGANISM="Thalassiosira miniscula, Strain CCMP1093" /LENGTH=289 /DNA_ID=CAMNT_0025933969 /DNA_START=166 /DNA_END=1035 /DNA_ORIENTATION=-